MASTWDQRYYSPHLARWLTEVVPTWGLHPGDHILDVGTGTGLLIPFLRHVIGASGTITAIDYAEHMIQICRSKYGHLANVMIELHDIEVLDLPSTSFDAITCFGVFPHLDQKALALANFYRVLKSGGQLIIAHALSRAEIQAHIRTLNQRLLAMSCLQPQRCASSYIVQGLAIYRFTTIVDAISVYQRNVGDYYVSYGRGRAPVIKSMYFPISRCLLFC